MAQIFKQSVSNESAVSEQSVSIQRAPRKHLESTQRQHSREQSMNTQSIKIRVNTIGAYKYCVLFNNRKVLSPTCNKPDLISLTVKPVINLTIMLASCRRIHFAPRITAKIKFSSRWKRLSVENQAAVIGLVERRGA